MELLNREWSDFWRRGADSSSRANSGRYGANLDAVVRFPADMERISAPSCDFQQLSSEFRRRRATFNSYRANFGAVVRLSTVIERISALWSEFQQIWSEFWCCRATFNSYRANFTSVEQILIILYKFKYVYRQNLRGEVVIVSARLFN